MCMKNQNQQYETNPLNFVRGDFESKLRALQMHMMVELQVVLVSFLAFASFYNVSKAHNMLALLLDPCLKSFDVVKHECKLQCT